MNARGNSTGFRFCNTGTIGFSVAHKEVRNFSKRERSQFREAVGRTSPVSNSTSSTSALGKPRKTISSRRIGRISSGRSADNNRSAADSVEDRWSTKASAFGLSNGVAIPSLLLNQFWPIHDGEYGVRGRGLRGVLFRPPQLREPPPVAGGTPGRLARPRPLTSDTCRSMPQLRGLQP